MLARLLSKWADAALVAENRRLGVELDAMTQSRDSAFRREEMLSIEIEHLNGVVADLQRAAKPAHDWRRDA